MVIASRTQTPVSSRSFKQDDSVSEQVLIHPQERERKLTHLRFLGIRAKRRIDGYLNLTGELGSLSIDNLGLVSSIAIALGLSSDGTIRFVILGLDGSSRLGLSLCTTGRSSLCLGRSGAGSPGRSGLLGRAGILAVSTGSGATLALGRTAGGIGRRSTGQTIKTEVVLDLLLQLAPDVGARTGDHAHPLGDLGHVDLGRGKDVHVS